MIDFRGFSSRMNLSSFWLAGEENTMHSQQHLYQFKRMIDSAIQDFAERYTAQIEAYIKELCTAAFTSVVQGIESHINASVHIAVDNANSILIDEKTTEYLSNEIAKQIQKNLKDIVLSF